MKRCWLASATALALALIGVAVWGLSATAQEEPAFIGIYPTITYVPPVTLIGAEVAFDIGSFTAVYGYDTLWTYVASSAIGKYWAVGVWIYDLSGGSPGFDMSIGLGYSWFGWLDLQAFFTATGWYGLAISFTLTAW